jgi:tetratricopeptide (TPR) repeat protein
MIREVLRQEMMGKLSEILNRRDLIDLEDDNFYHLSLAFYQFLLKFEPNCKEYISRIGETYHLMSDLKKSAQYYKKVLENEPPQALSHKE